LKSDALEYDAEGNRVEVHGSTVTDYIYFGGAPIAMLSSSGAYTDLIYGGGSLIAEVGGTQNAVPAYRITDNLGSLGSVNYSPYGQIFSGSTSDTYGFTGLQSDPTTALYHATFRQYSIQQGRWQSPDPSAGSYDWANPQSLNRYVYVNGRPTAFTDPSGRYLNGAVEPAAAAVGLPCPVCWAVIAGTGTIYDLGRTLGWWGDKFHGHIGPRPSTPDGEPDWDKAMNESLGMPTGWHPNGNLIGGIQGALGLPTMAGANCLPICEATALNGKSYDFWSCMADGANQVSLAAILPKGTPTIIMNLASNDFASLQQIATGPNRWGAAASVAEGKGANLLAELVGSIPIGSAKYILGQNGAGNYFVRNVIVPRVGTAAIGTALATASEVKLAWDLGTYIAGLGTCPVFGR